MVYIPSGLVSGKDRDPGMFGACEQIWWAAAEPAGALWEVWLASGTPVPQSWPHHRARCPPGVAHRGSQ